MEKTCKECGQAFDGKNPSKFCCNICNYNHAVRTGSKAHHAKPKGVMYHGICAHCGNAFTSERKRKYCKPECDTEAQLCMAKASRIKPGRLCKQCGEELPSTRRVYCSDECEELFNKGKNTRVTDAVATERIASRYNTIVYVGGYAGEGSMITVRCKTCGGEFRLYARALRITYEAKCPHCIERQSEADAEQAERARLVRRLMVVLRKQVRTREDVAYRTRKCIVCGEAFIAERGTTGTQLCSTACMIRRKKEHKHNARHKRRVKYRGSSDLITIRELYQRDKGTCYICGSQCDFDDMRIDGATHMAGRRYPSIDHVYPLAKGGAHTWDNVRLACCLCNALKRDGIA